jgi:hypothetical protein
MEHDIEYDLWNLRENIRYIKENYMGAHSEQIIGEAESTGRTIEEVLIMRGKRYGEYRNVSQTAQLLKSICHSSESWPMMEPYMQESLDLICNKMARICNGDPFYDDSWKDIAGYAQLVTDELEKL